MQELGYGEEGGKAGRKASNGNSHVFTDRCRGMNAARRER